MKAQSLFSSSGEKRNIFRLLNIKPSILNGLRHANACLLVHADSKGPDQPAHPRILIRAIAVRKHYYWIL